MGRSATAKKISTVGLRLEIRSKKTAFIDIRAANRTGTLCLPVIDYILACDFVVADSIKIIVSDPQNKETKIISLFS